MKKLLSIHINNLSLNPAKKQFNRPERFKVTPKEIADIRKKYIEACIRKCQIESDDWGPLAKDLVPFLNALFIGNLKLVKELYPKMLWLIPQNNLPLAAISGKLDVVQYLIDQNEDINAVFGDCQYSALHIATAFNDKAMIALLKKHGAQPLRDYSEALPEDYEYALGYKSEQLPITSLQLFKDQAIHQVPIEWFEQETGSVFCPYVQTKLDYFLFVNACGYNSSEDISPEAKEIIKTGGDSNLILAKIDDNIGYGVFAGKRFYKGDPVVSYAGVLSHGPLTPHSNYVIGSKLCIDAEAIRNLGGMINHSDSANVISEEHHWKGRKYSVFYATQDIPYGKQITLNYRWDKLDDRLSKPLKSANEGEFPAYLPLPFLKEKAIGSSHFRKKDYNAAIDHFSAAIDLNPKSQECFFNRGLCKKNLKDYTGAVADFKSALTLDPRYEKARLNINQTQALINSQDKRRKK